MKRAIVLGAGGFIGSHLVKRLKSEGYWVRGIDLKCPEFSPTKADSFYLADLRDIHEMYAALSHWPSDSICEIYQLAADMGGAGYLFTGDNDADVMWNSAQINLNILDCVQGNPHVKIFFSSSACIYPQYNQLDPNNPNCAEDTAYPASPDSEYGWEKLFSERLYLSAIRNWGVDARIARFHTIFGEEGTWTGGKEKAVAALCRKVAENDEEIEVWGDGEQTRTFLHVDECVEGIRRLMQSDFAGPVNIGSEELVTVNQTARMIMAIANKSLTIKHVEGPQGVRGRKSDNRLIEKKLGWKPTARLEDGLTKTYAWIEKQVKLSR